MLALTLFTAGQRFVKVWRQASVPKAEPRPRRRRRPRVTNRTTVAWRQRSRTRRR
jgi:hypothetical protein